MRIELEAAAPIDEPTPEEVEHGLRSLRLPDNSFAILEASPGSYIQAAGDEDSFDLEYQQGSTDDHYRVPDEVRLEEAIGAFQRYLRQDGAWR